MSGCHKPILLVSDDKVKVLQMDVETTEEVSKNLNVTVTDNQKSNQVSYVVFYKKVKNESENIKTSINKERKMTPKKMKSIKGMIKKHSKKLQPWKKDRKHD